eukprot:scaffold49240_cov65-Attheya_sp.AAC.4
MAKKPRSQRRKKGSGPGLGMGEDDEGAGDVDVLPDDHTVADTVASFQSIEDEWNAPNNPVSSCLQKEREGK